MPEKKMIKKLEKELSSKTEYLSTYRELFDFSRETILIYKNGLIVDINRAVNEMFGYTPNELIGKTTETLWNDDKDIKIDCSCKISDATQTQGIRKDGSTFPIEVRIKNINIEDSKTGVVSIKDLSECLKTEDELRKRNEELLNQNRELELMRDELISSRKSFFQSVQGSDVDISEQDLKVITTYGRWSYNFKNDKVSWTPEVRDIVGYENNDSSVSIDSFRNKVHPEDIDEVEALFFKAIRSKQLFKAEFRFMTKGGIEKQVLAQALPQYNEKGEVLNLLGTLLDITNRKSVENKLKRQRDHYLKLNEELIISRRQAEESEKMKTAFFSNMSHEIRTPMNGILSFSNLLLDEDTTEDERIEYSKIIVNSGKRLLHIVNDVLDISKLESDTVKIIKTDIKVNDVLEGLFCLFSQDKKVVDGAVKLSINTPLDNEASIITTDQNRLCQIVTNLLSNALKFTESGAIKFGYTVGDDTLDFYVEDSGIGIPEEMQQLVFEPFRQVEGHIVKQHGGTGLGLSISRKLSQLLGGELTMESAEGKGSRFNFSLPYQAQERPTKTPPQEALQHTLRHDIKDVTLLIAEDDEVNFLFFRSFLGSRLTIIRAHSGVEAIELTQQHPEIDVILMDVKMPEMNGLTAIKEIKKNHPSLPIIVQSAYAMPEDKKDALDAGADDYITKPINRRELLNKIHNFCVK